VLKGEAVVAPPAWLAIERSLPHGHVAAVLGMAKKLSLDRLVPCRPERLATLALALVVARVLEPAAKLATARQLSAAHSPRRRAQAGRGRRGRGSIAPWICWARRAQDRGGSNCSEVHSVGIGPRARIWQVIDPQPLSQILGADALP